MKNINWNTKISITAKSFSVVSLCYLVLPIIIFFFGFLKLYWALLFGMVIFTSFYFFLKDDTVTTRKEFLNVRSSVEIKVWHLALLFVVAVMLSVLSGVGEFIYSSYDHRVRWATLYDLVKYKWPVIYDLSEQQNPEVAEYVGTGKVALSYYLCFWMVPAAFGKIFGLLVARITLVIWAALGLSLIFVGTQFLTRSRLLLSILVLVGFGGLDVLPYLLQVAGNASIHPENWNKIMPIFGFYPQLTMVANQCIPIWLITVVLLLSKNNHFVGFIGALAFVYSPWATFGIFPVAMFMLFTKGNIRDAVNVNNFIVPVMILMVFVPFYTANPNASSIHCFTWFMYDYFDAFIFDYVAVVVIEFIVWFFLLYKNKKENMLLVLLLIELLIFPFYKISLFNDWLMRGTIAPLFILSLFVVDMVNDAVVCLRKHIRQAWAAAVLILVIISSFSGLYSIVSFTGKTFTDYKDNRENTVLAINSFGNINKTKEVYVVDLQFYVRDYEESFFYKVYARI